MQDTDKSEKIVRLKLSEQVLGKLQEMIRLGELKPGDKVPSERALMERFGVGRPAVREALQSLHTQGLITITHGERSRVNKISPQTVLGQSDHVARLFLAAEPANLEHLKEARRMFEIGVVRAAAEKATDKDIARLRELVEIQRAHLPSIDTDKAFVMADMNFHTAIVDMLENPVLSAVSASMLSWLLEYHEPLLHWSGQEHITLKEHGQIINALEANDADAAAEALKGHLDRSQVRFNARTPRA